MMKRLKTRFDLLRPDLDKTIVKKQEVQARNYKGNKSKMKSFDVGDNVYFKNYSRGGPPNTPGIVEECTGPLSCKIISSDGNIVHRHFDQMFKQVKPSDIENNASSVNEGFEQPLPLSNSEPVSNAVKFSENNETILQGSKGNNAVTGQVSPVKPPVVLRRSSHVHKPVQRLDL